MYTKPIKDRQSAWRRFALSLPASMLLFVSLTPATSSADELCAQSSTTQFQERTIQAGDDVSCSASAKIVAGPQLAVQGGTLSLFAPQVAFVSPTTVSVGAQLSVSASNPAQVWQSALTLVEVSALDTQGIVLSWLPVDDGITPADQITYAIHLSETADFTPSASTLMHQQTGAQSAEVNGLTSGVMYYVRVLASDLAGHLTESRQARIRIPSTVTQQNSGQTTISLGADDVLQVNPSTLVLATGVASPPVGSILTSDPLALLRRVVAVSVNGDGTLLVQTESAALNEVFDQLHLSSGIRLAPVPPFSPAAARGFNKADGPVYRVNAAGESTVHWPGSRLTLTSPPPNLVSTAPKALSAGLAASRAAGQDLYSEAADKTATGNHATVSGPSAVAIVPGNHGTMTLVVDLYQDEEEFFGSDPIPLTLCEVTDLEIEAPSGKSTEGLVTLGQFMPSDVETVPDYGGGTTLRTKRGTKPLYIHAGENQVSDQPYKVRVEAYVDEAGNHCETNDVFREYGDWLGWEEKVKFEFNLFVTSAPNFPTKERETLQFSGGFSVSNTVDFSYAPTLEADVMFDGASLQHARLEARTDARLFQELAIEASGAAVLDRTLPLIDERRFIKVFLAGSVPIVMKGSLNVDVRIEGSVTGAMSAIETLNMGFDELAYGIEYEKGQWYTTENIEPVYQLSLRGDADAEANLRISMLPRLAVTFYEAATGILVAEPYLHATAGIHGQIYLDTDPNGTALDQDWWLTKGKLSGGLNAWLYAKWSILDYTIADWPDGADPTDYTTFRSVPIIAETAILGLPTLEANQVEGTHPFDSRALLFEGTHQDVANPFQQAFGLGPDAFITFRKWTEPKVIVANDTGYELLNQVGVNNNRFWIRFRLPGTYTVRMAGYSSLGGWSRQVAPDVTITLTDNDFDGMLDHWEAAYGISDPNGNDDGDELTNLEEFLAGRDPKRIDTDHEEAITYQWATGWYGVCEVEDGETTGQQSRDVWCETQVGATPVLDLFCDAGTRPQATQNCTAFTTSLNDTGIDWCADADTNNLPCPVAGFPGQDAEHGRDATHHDDSDGHAGFSFTKLDANGFPLPASATEWSCVRDNVTGLTWEVKTEDGGIHDADNTYRWGGQTALGSGFGVYYGDWNLLVAGSNSEALCGFNDWRVPTVKELEGIVSRDRIAPAIDTDYFPNTRSSLFWSSSPRAGDSGYAWNVDFNDGVNKWYRRRNDSLHLRMVRSGQ